jgi:hypothetical protein
MDHLIRHIKSLEERIERLEKEVAELRRAAVGTTAKKWTAELIGVNEIETVDEIGEPEPIKCVSYAKVDDGSRC